MINLELLAYPPQFFPVAGVKKKNKKDKRVINHETVNNKWSDKF